MDEEEKVFFMVSLNEVPEALAEDVRASVMQICKAYDHKNVVFHYDDPLSTDEEDFDDED
jgi:hypothetical protein